MFTERLISFETAKLAKVKGFDIETSDYYWNGELYYDDDFPSLQPTKPEDSYTAHPQSLLQRWLREVHNLFIVINVMIKDNNIVWGYSVEKSWKTINQKKFIN